MAHSLGMHVLPKRRVKEQFDVLPKRAATVQAAMPSALRKRICFTFIRETAASVRGSLTTKTRRLTGRRVLFGTGDDFRPERVPWVSLRGAGSRARRACLFGRRPAFFCRFLGGARFLDHLVELVAA